MPISFQSLIGILVDFNGSVPSWHGAINQFQSLIGILVDFNLVCGAVFLAIVVSIPDRDFS